MGAMKNENSNTMCQLGVLEHPAKSSPMRRPNGHHNHTAGAMSLALGGSLVRLGRSVVLVTLLVALSLAGLGLAATAV